MALWSELNIGVKLLPEQHLIMAIVERAVLDYVGPGKTDLHHKRSARKFLISDSEELFSFRWISQHLPYDPDWFRETVLKFVEKLKALRKQEAIERRCGSVAE